MKESGHENKETSHPMTNVNGKILVNRIYMRKYGEVFSIPPTQKVRRPKGCVESILHNQLVAPDDNISIREKVAQKPAHKPTRRSRLKAKLGILLRTVHYTSFIVSNGKW